MKITDKQDVRVWRFDAEPERESKLAKEVSILLACFIGAGMWCGAYWIFVRFLIWIGR